MQTLTLEAKTRTTKGRKNDPMRQEGMIPAVVYGADIEPMSIEVGRNAFIKVYESAGESSLVTLAVDEKPINVLVQDVQLHPVQGSVIHADFRAIDMKKKVEAEVKIEFTGSSIAVDSLGGTLARGLETLSVSALPTNLVSSIEVDITPLASFDDSITIADIKAPEGIEILNEADQTVATVTPPRSEEEMAALDEAVEEDVSAVEVEGEKKDEESSEEKSEEKSAE